MRPSDRAWITLGAGVLSYDLLASPGQTLSEGADSYMLKHPWLTRAVAFALAAHCCNMIPDRFDVIHLIFARLRAWKCGGAQ